MVTKLNEQMEHSHGREDALASALRPRAAGRCAPSSKAWARPASAGSAVSARRWRRRTGGWRASRAGCAWPLPQPWRATAARRRRHGALRPADGGCAGQARGLARHHRGQHPGAGAGGGAVRRAVFRDRGRGVAPDAAAVALCQRWRGPGGKGDRAAGAERARAAAPAARPADRRGHARIRENAGASEQAALFSQLFGDRAFVAFQRLDTATLRRPIRTCAISGRSCRTRTPTRSSARTMRSRGWASSGAGCRTSWRSPRPRRWRRSPTPWRRPPAPPARSGRRSRGCSAMSGGWPARRRPSPGFSPGAGWRASPRRRCRCAGWPPRWWSCAARSSAPASAR